MSNIFGYPNYISGGSGGGTEVNAGAGLSSTTNPDGSITLAASGPFLTWYYSPEIANSRQVVGGNNVTVSTAIDGQLVISAAATGGGAPTVSSYIVGTTEASLPNSSVATEGNGITIAVTPGGAATFGVSTAITGADILTWQPGDTIFTDRRALILGSGLSADFGSNTLTLNVTGQNAGTVTSVGLSAPSWLTVGSTPVTTAGTISLTATNQSANTLLMGPSGGAAAASAFRKLLAVDLPISAGSGITLSTDATGGLNIASSGGSGSVTSVGLALPTDTFTITNSPVTGTGTLTGTYANQAINTFLAGASSGSSATPLWRILTRNDLPITPGSNVTFSLNSSGGLAINASVSGGGGGTVTSVDSTTPTSLFTVSGNPITLSGTLAYALTNAASSKVWAGPVSGADAAPTYRSLVAGDIPTLPFTKISGTVPVAQGGTNLTATPANGQLPIGNGTDYTLATITPGTGVQVSNGAGTITVSATGALGGTVTSVAQSVPTSLLSITGSPITGAGTLAIGLTNAASATFWRGPTSGADGTPSYGAIVATDLPTGIPAINIGAGSVDNTEFGYLDGVTSAIQTQFSNKQPLDATLTALAAYNTNGLLTQTAANTFVGRTITGTANKITVTNGDGVSGNPTLTVGSDIAQINSGNSWSTAQLPNAAGTIDLGSTALPFRNIILGGAATNNTKLVSATTTAQRTVTFPDANSNTVIPDTGAANNFLTAISAGGVISKAQPAFSNISGTTTAGQLPSTAVNSTGNLSPLFTSSISAQALSFSLSTAAASTALRGPTNNASGAAASAAAPTYRVADPIDIPIFRNDIRVTATSLTPVPSGDVTAATTLYVTPYLGNQVTIYNTTQSKWITQTFAQASVSVPATTNTPFDVFITPATNSTITVSTVNWSNDTTRATNLTLLDGRYVNASNNALLYVGTCRTTGSSGQTEDSRARRLVWNYYNRVARSLYAYESTSSWTYSSSTVRAANNNTTPGTGRTDFVIGVSEQVVSSSYYNLALGNSTLTSFAMGIAFDSTTTFEASNGISTAGATGDAIGQISTVSRIPTIGYHYIQNLEQAAGSTSQAFVGDQGASGLYTYQIGVIYP